MLGPEQPSARSLVKEEKSYIKEAEDQEARVATFESEGKEEWEVKKQVCTGRLDRAQASLTIAPPQREVLQDCRQMIPDCRKRLLAAVDDLQSILVSEQSACPCPISDLRAAVQDGVEGEVAESDEAKAAKEALQSATLSAQSA